MAPVKIIVEAPAVIEPALTLKLPPNDKVEFELGLEILKKLVLPESV